MELVICTELVILAGLENFMMNDLVLASLRVVYIYNMVCIYLFTHSLVEKFLHASINVCPSLSILCLLVFPSSQSPIPNGNS